MQGRLHKPVLPVYFCMSLPVIMAIIRLLLHSSASSSIFFEFLIMTKTRRSAIAERLCDVSCR